MRFLFSCTQSPHTTPSEHTPCNTPCTRQTRSSRHHNTRHTPSATLHTAHAAHITRTSHTSHTLQRQRNDSQTSCFSSCFSGFTCWTRNTTEIAVLAPFPRQLASGVRLWSQRCSLPRKSRHGDPGRNCAGNLLGRRLEPRNSYFHVGFKYKTCLWIHSTLTSNLPPCPALIM